MTSVRNRSAFALLGALLGLAAPAGAQGIPEGFNRFCPISQKPASTLYTTETRGKKVYFCCKKCIKTFNEEDITPYLPVLPQFAELAAAKKDAGGAEKKGTPGLPNPLCPVLGEPSDPDIKVEHQGKTVHFCCTKCRRKFQQQPSLYLAKLPQFISATPARSAENAEGRENAEARGAVGAGDPPATNTICPVMTDRKAKPEFVVEHDGKQVRLCCKKCVRSFTADPKPYLKFLPQFGGFDPALRSANVLCPVMPDRKARAEYSVQHEGKTVYLCCAKCQKRFTRDPKPFLALLPQFGGKPPVPEGGPAAAPEPVIEWWGWRLSARLHPVLVHYPIALIILAAFLELLQMRRRRPGLDVAIGVNLVAGVLGAATAAFSGWKLAAYEGFDGEAAKILEIHRSAGLTVTGAVLAATLLFFATRWITRGGMVRAYRAVLLVAAAATGVAGHYGGMLVYGEDYLTSVWPKPDVSEGVALEPASSLIDVSGTFNPPVPETVQFNRDIRPILSENCFKCHGFDVKRREANLRLDNAAGATADLGGYAAIVPGAPEASEAFLRAAQVEPENRMPPPDSGKQLTFRQIAILKRWIAQGGEYQPHWAFVPPKKAAPPAVADAAWPKNDIDRFVLARLERAGLKPAPEADRTMLVRRVALDLTGLPPTPEEVDAYANDAAPDAYEKMVDRYLASPRYGEKMALPWLDAARYADTHGYHIDSHRDMWIWRDWLIDAFNRNLPYDRFVVDQIAGDLVPDATRDQLVASGFNRNHMINFEGGAIEEEYHVEYVVDRVKTTSTVFLGLTMGCAQCHDHKYDPITQRDYYRFYAFFNSIDDNGLDGRSGNAVPILRVPLTDQEAKLKDIRAKIEAAEARLNGPDPELDGGQASWEEDLAGKLPAWTVLDPARVESAGGATLAKQPDGSILASGPNPGMDLYEFEAVTDRTGIRAVRLEALTDASFANKSTGRSPNGNFALSEFEAEVAPASEPETWRNVRFTAAYADYAQLKFPATKAIDGNAATAWAVDGHVKAENRTALFLTGEPVGFPGGTRIRVRMRFRSEFPQHAIGRFRLAVTADTGLMKASVPSTLGTWQLAGPFLAKDGKPYPTDFGPEAGPVDLKAVYEWDGKKIGWKARPEFEDGDGHLLEGEYAATYAYRTVTAPSPRKMTISVGSDDAIKVWANGKVVLDRDLQRAFAGDQDQATFDLPEGRSDILMKIVNYTGGYAFSFRAAREDGGGVAPEIAEVLGVPVEARTDAQKRRMRDAYRRDHWPEWTKLEKELAGLRGQETEVEKLVPTTMVMKDRAMPRETRILMRGQYDKPGEKVEPGTPESLPPMPKDAPANRLGLARWIADPAHPLTARVAVNRLWEEIFGAGIVRTVEDFGAQGESPTHPELLDWLAVEFVERGWDVKGILKTILTSATYRQSPATTPEKLEKDPENRLLSRGARYRLPAELLRDGALAASGLLVGTIGGPSVKPYQPAEIWKPVAFDPEEKQFTAQVFRQDTGEKLYRRSLYTFVKRSCPPTNMQALDAPNREVCIVRRSRTNTPLQALTLLNDPTFVEASRALAQRMILEGGETPEGRIARGFRLAVARAPSAEETKVLLGIVAPQLEIYRKDPEKAKQFLAVGEFKPDAKLDPAELAAWSVAGSVILNLDETVTRE